MPGNLTRSFLTYWRIFSDTIGWITRAKRPETQQKRLNQMLDELEKGNVYMKMDWKKSRTLRNRHQSD